MLCSLKKQGSTELNFVRLQGIENINQVCMRLIDVYG